MKKKKSELSENIPHTASLPKDKSAGSNMHSIAILFLILAIIILIGSFWMFIQTIGTNLLFVSAFNGQLYRQYPIFLLLGLLFLIVAVGLFRAESRRVIPARTEKTNERVMESEGIPVEENNEGTEDGSAEVQKIAVTVEKTSNASADEPLKRFCTKCGAALTEEMKFCTKCGNPVNGEKSL